MEKQQQWNKLTSDEERIIVHKGTEYPGTGKYYKFTGDGVYECRRCNAPLYDSKDKFASECGWYHSMMKSRCSETHSGCRWTPHRNCMQ
jgi:peptide methionine sulfoxide reductase MsrB